MLSFKNWNDQSCYLSQWRRDHPPLLLFLNTTLQTHFNKVQSWPNLGNPCAKSPSEGTDCCKQCTFLKLTVAFFCSTHSLGLASTGGGSLLTDASVMSSSEGLHESLCSSSSSSGSLKCTRRPTLELVRATLWLVRLPVFRQELGGGSGKGTTTGLPFWWVGVPLTLELMSGDAAEGLDTSCCAEVSNADGAAKSLGYGRIFLAPCVPLDPSGSLWWEKGSKFGMLVLWEFKQKLLLRVEGSRLGRLVRRGSGRSMLELWGSKRRVLVFKGSRRKVLETSGSRRMVLECGLMLLVTAASGWGFTVGADGGSSWTWLGSTIKLPEYLTWLLLLPLPEDNQRHTCRNFNKDKKM